MARVAVALLLLLLLASPAAAQGIDDWSDRWRGEPYPGTCDGRFCFGGPNVTAPGEWLMFVGTGFTYGMPVMMRILAPDGSERHQHFAGPNDELWRGSFGPRIDFIVPADAERGNWSARLESEGRVITHPFRVAGAPRIFPQSATPPTQGAATSMRIVGFEEGPFEITTVQNGTRWNASYQLHHDSSSWVTLASRGMNVPGAKVPEFAMRAQGTLSMIESGFTVIAPPGSDVVVWANGTREGERVSDAMTFVVPQGGQRAWVRVLPSSGVVVSPGGPVSYMPTPSGACRGVVDGSVHVFGAGQHGQVPVRIYGPDGALVAGSDVLAADYVEETIPLWGAPPGRYVATIGEERVEFGIGDGCAPTTPMRYTPPARRRGIPAPALEVVAMVALVAIAGRWRR